MEWVDGYKKDGYSEANAQSRVCQDLILKAIAKSSLNRNVTIKGGVVMRSVTGNIRRATQDIDIDFIRYSLEEDSIMHFVSKLNCLDGIIFEIIGRIEELKQQDYYGKRVYVGIIDNEGNSINSKIDLGVHKNLSIKQEEYCFDVCFQDDGACLLVNSMEQMLTEKLRSLLKFGPFSTRYKDIFDICYLTEIVDEVLLAQCLENYIFLDQGMRENNLKDIQKRIKQTLSNKNYQKQLSSTDKNWLNKDTDEVLELIISFFERLENAV
jgi:predicted nucleotidyltransferase component of viral defense system